MSELKVFTVVHAINVVNRVELSVCAATRPIQTVVTTCTY